MPQLNHEPPMQSTPKMSVRLAPALDDTMRDAWKEMVGVGQDSWDVAKRRRKPWLMTLRFVDRAFALGVPKARVMAFCAAVTAAVDATYPDEQDATLSEVSLAEEDANHALNSVQIEMGRVPSVSMLLEAKRRGRRQIEATVRFCAQADRELARM